MVSILMIVRRRFLLLVSRLLWMLRRITTIIMLECRLMVLRGGRSFSSRGSRFYTGFNCEPYPLVNILSRFLYQRFTILGFSIVLLLQVELSSFFISGSLKNNSKDCLRICWEISRKASRKTSRKIFKKGSKIKEAGVY